ncbi:MAG: response regulator transcription factor [Asticcacaulis sp.]
MSDTRKTVLLADNDEDARHLIHILLGMDDLHVESCASAGQALKMTASLRPDLLLVDLDLPDVDGVTLIKKIRLWSRVPIIALAATRDIRPEAQALNAGADDYVTKPFNGDILLARIHANLRHHEHGSVAQKALVNGPVRMDLDRHEVTIAGAPVAFSPKEFEMLRLLMLNRGCVLTRRQIMQAVWGCNDTENIHYLRVYIRQLREKLNRAAGLKHAVVCEPGVGYRMEVLSSAMTEAVRVN